MFQNLSVVISINEGTLRVDDLNTLNIQVPTYLLALL